MTIADEASRAAGGRSGIARPYWGRLPFEIRGPAESGNSTMRPGLDVEGRTHWALDGQVRDVHRIQDTFPPETPSRRRRGRKVLVVDDQPEALLSTVELFRVMGYDVLEACNGDDAIQVLAQVPDIEVLFTDVFMPRMDGVRLGREARRLIPGINVILVSGFPASAMDLHAGEPGEFHFLMKPFLMSEVAIVLRR